MQFIPFFIASILLIASAAFEMTSISTAKTKLATAQRQYLGRGLDRAASDLVDNVNTAVASGTSVNGPFSTSYTQTIAPCEPGDSSVLCNDTIAITATLAGSTAGQGSGGTETLPNVNTAVSDGTATPIEGRVSYRVDTQLISASNNVVATRSAMLSIRTTNSPPTFAVFNGFTDLTGDDAGSHAEANVSGQCDPTQAGCGGAGLDSGLDLRAQSLGGAGADDTRVHSETACLDPDHAAGLHPGDLCAPTGNPAQTPVPNDSFTAPTMPNADENATSGWSH